MGDARKGGALQLQLFHARRLDLEVPLNRREMAELLQGRLLLRKLVLARDALLTARLGWNRARGVRVCGGVW